MEIFVAKNKSGIPFLFVDSPDIDLHELLIRAKFRKVGDKNLWYRPVRGFSGFLKHGIVPKNRLLWPDFRETGLEIALFPAKILGEPVMIATGSDASKLSEIGFHRHQTGVYFNPMRNLGTTIMAMLQVFPGVRIQALEIHQIGRPRSTDAETTEAAKTSGQSAASAVSGEAEAAEAEQSVTKPNLADLDAIHRSSAWKIDDFLVPWRQRQPNEHADIDFQVPETLFKKMYNSMIRSCYYEDDVKEFFDEILNHQEEKTFNSNLSLKIMGQLENVEYTNNCLGKNILRETLEAFRRFFVEDQIVTKSLNGFNLFQDQKIRNLVWQAIRNGGFSGGNVLVPSLSYLAVLEQCPEDLEVSVLAFESLPLLIELCRKKYPEISIVEGLPDEVFIGRGTERFDLLIGGFDCPSDAIRYDPIVSRPVSTVERQLLQCMRYLKPGGLAILEMDYTFLDAPAPDVRIEIARHCHFDAIRVKDCDFVVLKKRKEPISTKQARQEPWIYCGSLREVMSSKRLNWKEIDFEYPINRYFIEHPEKYFVTPVVVPKYGANNVVFRDSLKSRQGVDLADIVQKMIKAVAMREDEAVSMRAVKAASNRKLAVSSGCYVLSPNGQLAILQQDGSLQPAKIRSSKMAAILADAIRLRDLLIEHINLEMSTQADELAIEASRQTLHEQYMRFRDQHGPLSSEANRRALLSDPLGYLLLSLEQVRRQNGQEIYEPAAILRQRVLFPNDAKEAMTEHEAAIASLIQFGHIDFHWIAEQLQVDNAHMAMARLCHAKAAFFDPELGAWIDGASYLSGNVRRKLKAACQAAEYDPLMHINIEVLESVLPEWVPYHLIDIDPSAKYIDPNLIEQFLEQKSLTVASGVMQEKIEMRYNEETGKWQWNTKALRFASPYNTSETGTHEVLQCVLNHRNPVVIKDGKMLHDVSLALYHNAERFKEDFLEWLGQSPERRQTVENAYNEQFNACVKRNIDTEKIRLSLIDSASVSAFFHPRPNQISGMVRILTDKKALIAHEMGCGKTALMLASAVALKRHDPGHVSVIVVPENILDRVMMEAATYFPGGRFLFPIETSKKHLQDFLKKAIEAPEKFDAVIMTQAMFKNIPMATPPYDVYYATNATMSLQAMSRAVLMPDFSSRYLVIRKAYARRGRLLRTNCKKIKDYLKSGNSRADMGITLEDLKIDTLFYDEIHLAKKIPLKTSHSALGLPSGDSNMGRDLLQKLDWLRQCGARIVGLTGTPINNSIAEIYVNQRLIDPKTLYQNRIFHFDEWLALYADTESVLEKSPSGEGYRFVSRFCKIRNAAEMMQSFGEFADIVFLEQADVPIPKQENVTISIDRHPFLDDYSRILAHRYRDCIQGAVNRREDNVLQIMNNGFAAAQDIRLTIPAFPKVPNRGKIDRLIAELYEEWRRTRDQHGTQIVFLDIGTPQNQKVNLFQEIRDTLVSFGVPKSEILLSSDWMQYSGKKRVSARSQALHQFRNGIARILVGTTDAIGTGIDAPDRVTAIHMVNPTWRPDQLEQRIRRGVRPGNRNDQVRVLYYIQKGSMDEFYWQSVQRKANFIKDMLRYDSNARHFEERHVVPYDELLAIAQDNPLLKEKHETVNQIRYIESRLRDHEIQHALLAKKLEQHREECDALKQDIGETQNRIQVLRRWLDSPDMLKRLTQAARFAKETNTLQPRQPVAIDEDIVIEPTGVIRLPENIVFLTRYFLRATRSATIKKFLQDEISRQQLFLKKDMTKLINLEATIQENLALRKQDGKQMQDKLKQLRQKLADIDVRLSKMTKMKSSDEDLENDAADRMRLRLESKARFLALVESPPSRPRPTSM